MSRSTRKSEGPSPVRQFRSTDVEWKKISGDASKAGMTISEWIRFALQEADVKSLLEKIAKGADRHGRQQNLVNMKADGFDMI